MKMIDLLARSMDLNIFLSMQIFFFPFKAKRMSIRDAREISYDLVSYSLSVNADT